MKIIRAKDYYDMSAKRPISSRHGHHEPNCVLGLATGGTPVGTYNSWLNGTTRATLILRK